MTELNRPRYFLSTIGKHLLCWIAYLGLLVFLFSGRFPIEWAFERALLLAFLQVPMVYMNMEVLVPRFLEKKKYGLYFLLCLLVIIVIYYLYDSLTQPEFERASRMYGGNRQPEGTPFLRFDRPTFRGLINIFLSIFLLLFTSVIRMSKIASIKEKESALLKSEHLNSELKFLKSQINPHFLFNTLNNIYTLSMLKSDKTPDTIMKLSEMLRYILYECSDKDKVPIAKEVAYIRNYIDLQLLKDSDIINIKFEQEIEDNIAIAPMLLIPFIENSFKHSRIEDTEKGWIQIGLKCSKKEISFRCDNSIPAGEYKKDKTGGIGIENARRRLELLYPEQHELQITKKENVFSVQLRIKLNS